MTLTNARIEALASGKDVRRTPVINFLSTLSGNAVHDLGNLSYDAMLYRWNTATVDAIRTGIFERYKV